ncbi:MAG: glycosyltransferase [Ruminococcaceae bacterium]|nr:glycosyltransferase [Oscillospiraceae bacterium]
MKIVQMNATCGTGSTGKICSAIAALLDRNGVENYVFYSSDKSSDPHGKRFLSKRALKLQAVFSRVLGNYGFNTRCATRRILKKLDETSPDIVHLHNLHGHNVNLTLLFRYFKKHPEIKIIWTFHDCWAFTGYCTHFVMDKCDKWMHGCHDCPQRKKYSWFFDRSHTLYRRKKELFAGLDLTVVTPSEWLAGLVKQSFLKDSPVKVINNGIDLTVFQPRKSNFREKHNIPEDKYILLGVAFDWGERKGLDVFVDLAHSLPRDYQIVLVGTNGETDRQLPNNIISIHRTKNQTELAEIYSAADLFVNPTREENYPTVNMESIACGTPVLTFRTGGSPEIVDERCGCVVDCDDIKALKACIADIRANKPFDTTGCLERSASFDANDKFAEYIKLYNIRMEDKK